ncbi:damage suppressor protein-like [Hibiscus syriacus]|uniref:damage suppressor protein-like n=1 Tax=Hibiscus syriacus TaxID=106335 RepID=UPI001921BB4B|nr:damage suppressor protein-like [Hibiscus syriacus]XP_039050618.1 damage suppressor protein-like [Hibiscus syriacus]
MERNYVLLVAIFLLLIVVGCSGNDSKGNGDVKTGLDLNADGKDDPVIELVGSESVPDSIKDNGRDQTDGSERGVVNDASKSDLNQHSGSNGGKNLVKDGKESSGEEKGNMNNGKDNGGDQIDGSKEGAGNDASKSDLNQQSGSKEGKNLVKDGKELTDEANGNTNSGKDHGGDQIDGSKGGSYNDASKSDLHQQSGSNEGKNLVKDRKESSGEAKGNTNSGKDHGGDQIDGSKGGSDNDASKSDLHQQSGSNEGKNLVKDGKESRGEAKGNTNCGKDHERDQIDGSKGGADNDASKSDLNQQSGLNEGKTSVKDGKESTNREQDKGGEHIDKSDKGPKKVSKEEEIIQGSVQPPPPLPRNDGFQVAECDSSNMCMNMNKSFAACLRVAGNDSPNLLLLIQNKGKGPLTLKISAPPSVQLEETDVELEENQDKKVKISIKDSGTGNLIVLKDGTSDCSLDFKDLIPQNSAKSYVNILSLTPTTAFIFAAAILMLVSCWMGKSFRWRQLARSGSKYQRLDAGLPVSSRARREPDVNDGWDNSWGDNWDDEEAPVTPSMPKTPSVSSKGLASRRLNKDGWKD